MKNSLAIVVVVALVAQGVKAQGNPDLRRDSFNQVFFDALRNKVIDNMDEAFDLFTKARTLDPSNAQVCYELGLMHFNKGNLFMAESLLQTAVDLEGDNPYYLSALAEIYSKSGKHQLEEQVWLLLYDLEEDEQHLLQAAAAQFNAGEDKKALKTLAIVERDFGISEEIVGIRKMYFLRKGNVKKAAKEAQKLINTYPENPDYRRLLVQLYLANEMQKEGEKALRQLLQVAPNDPRANLEMAELLRKKGVWNESFFYLERSIASPDLPIDPKIQVLVSFYQETEKDTSLLELAYRLNDATILAHPRDPKGYAMKGDFLLRDRKLKEAREAFRRAVSLPNGDKPNLWNQILLINSELDDLEAIKKESQAAIELFPAQPLPYVLLGFAYLRDSSWQKAVTILEEGKMYAMGNRPLEAQFLTFLADAHHQLGNHATSDKYFERILEVNPNDVGAMNNYAYYLSLRKEKLDKALRITKRSNELSKDNPMFLDTWAWVHFQRGEYNEALELMERVVAFGIESGEVWEHYGDILANLSKMEEAIAAWQKALEIGGVDNEKIQIKIQKRQYVQ